MGASPARASTPTARNDRPSSESMGGPGIRHVSALPEFTGHLAQRLFFANQGYRKGL